MEGDGMVAIVQGLKDCGLSVTVVNKQQFVNALRSSSPCAGSSTSPRAFEIPDRGPVNNNASQITDGHYTSTYQVAHCNARPTSPRDYVTEFPPQRLERCPNQGNFQIGTGGYSMAPETSRARNLSLNEPSSLVGYSWLNDRPSVASGRLSPTRHFDIPSRAVEIQPARLSPNGRISPSGRESPTGHLAPSGRVSRSGRQPPSSGRLSSLGLKSSPIPGPADSDQFANTLRRYPLASPEQKGSSELVQKLLNFTQNKHLSKMSMPRTRSPYESPTRDVTTKNIQTYTRSKIEPTKDPGPSATHKIQSSKSQKGDKGVNLLVTSPWRVLSPCRSILPKKSNSPTMSTSPMKSTSPKRSNSPTRSNSPKRSTSPNKLTSPKRSTSPKRVNSPESVSPRGSITPYKNRNSRTYDYLQIGDGRLETSGRRVEVRYLDDVRKCIRDTLKQIYDDTAPVVCEGRPHADGRSRVLDDVKKVIRDTLNPLCDDDPPPVICPTVNHRYCQHRKMFHGENDKGSGTEPELTKKTERGQETEQQPQRNGFSSCKGAVPQIFWRLPENCSCKKKRPCICTYTSKDPEEVKLGAKIAEETINWVKDLPVYADEAREDKVIREKMIMDLVNNLKRMIGDPDFENNARKLIEECIEQLPIWYPGVKKDQETFKNQITHELVKNLNNVVDKMSDIVSNYIRGLEFTDNIDKGEVVYNIVKRLKPLADRPEDMETELKNMLQDLPILNKTKVIEMVSDKLVNDLARVAADVILENEIKKWLDNTPDLSSRENKTKDSKKLAKKLRQVLNRELDDSNYQEVVQEVVDDWIEEITSGENKLGTRTKANLADQLVNKIKTVNKDKLAKKPVKDRKKPIEKPSSLEQYEDRISEWLEETVDIPEENKEKYEGPVKDFAKKLQKLLSRGAGEDEIADEIINFLDYFIEQGETIVNKDKLAKKLMKDLKKPHERSSSLEQYEDRTSEWLTEAVGIPEENREKYEGPVKDFANRLQKLLSRGAGEDEIAEEIINFLDYFREQGETIVNKDKLAKKLMKDLKKPHERSSSLEQYEDRTSEWLTEAVGIPEENREKYEGPVKDFAKKLQKLQSRGAGEDEIADEIINFLDYFIEQGETIVNKDKLTKKLMKDLNKPNERSTSLEQYADRTSEWLTEAVGIPEENREKYEGPVKDFAKKLQKLQSRGAGEDEIAEEIINFLDYFIEQGETIVNKDKLAKKLMKDLKKPHERSSSLEQYEDRTSELLTEAVGIPEENREKYEDPVKDFAKRLQKLLSRGAGEDEIAEEIINSLDYFREQGETIANKDKLTKKLMKDLNKPNERSTSLEQYADRTSEWLTEAVAIPEENKEKYEGPVKDFANKLQQLLSRGAGEDEIAEEIINFLDYFIEQGETIVDKDKLTKKLMKDLKKPNERSSSLEQYADRTSEWLTEAVGIPEENREKYEGPNKDFAKKLQKLLSRGAGEDEIADEIINFLDYFIEQGETIVNKDKLAKKLMKDLKKPHERSSSLEQYEDRTSEWLTEAVGIPEENREKYEGPVKDFAKKLQKLLSRGAGEDEIAEEIINSLDYFREQGETIVNKDKLTKKLMKDLNKPNERSTSLEQYADRTSEWLTEAVGIPEENREKYEGPVKDFANKLQQLLSRGAGEDEIAEEIINFLDYFIEHGETIVDKDKLAKKLMKDLKKPHERSSSLEQYEDRTSELLTEAVGIPEENREKYEGPVKDFAKKMQKLLSRGAGEIAEEIINFLDYFIEQGETMVNKDKLAKKLMKDLKKPHERSSSLEQYEDRTSEWLTEAVGIPEENREKYEGPVKVFAKKLQKLQSRGAGEDEIAEEIINFLDYFIEQGETIVNKDKLAKKLMKDLKKPNERSSSLEQYEDRTSEWLTEAVGIPEENKEKYEGPVKDFAEKLQKLLSRGAGEDEIAEEITNFLDYFREQGETIVNKDKLAKKLMKDLKKPNERSSSLEQYADRTSEWLTEAVGIPEENREKYEGPVKDFAKKLQKLQSREAGEDEIADEIINFLDYFIEQGETIVNKDKLTKKLMTDLKKPNERSSSLEQYEDRTSEWLTEAVGIPEENKEKYEGPVKDFAEKLQKVLSRGAGEDEIAEEIINFLDYFIEQGETIVNKEKLAKKLMKDLKKPHESSSSLEQYEDRTSEWLTEAVGIPEENREKYEGPVKDFAKRLQKLLSRGAGEDEIAEEIINFLDYFIEQGETIVNKDKLAKKLMKDLKKPNERSSSLEQYADRTSEWLTEAVGIPEENREKYEGPVKDLAKKLQELLSIEAGDDEMVEEIQKFYNYLTNEGETVVEKDNLAKKLMKEILSLGEQNRNIPKSKKRKAKGEDKFSYKKKQEVKSSGTSDEETTGEKYGKNHWKDKKTTYRKPSLKQHENRDQECLKEKIDTAKVKSKKSKGVNLNKKMQGSSRTSDDETTDGESVVKRNKTAKRSSSLEQYEDRTSEWLTEAVGIPEENREKNEGPVKDFAKRLQELQFRGAGEDEIAEEIINFLDYFIEQGETIVNKDKLAKKLMKDLKKPNKRSSSLEQYEDRTSERLTEAVGIPEENRKKYEGLVKDFAKKLQKLQARGAGEDEIAEEIINSLDYFREQGETRKSKGDDKFSSKKKQEVKSSGTSDEETTGEKYGKNRWKDKKTTYRKPSLKQHENRDQECLKEKIDTAKVKSKKSKGVNLNKKMQGSSRTSDDETTDGESVVKRNKTAKILFNDPKTDRKPSLGKQYENEPTSNILRSFRKQSILKEISGSIGDLPSDISESKQTELKNDISNILTENFNNLPDQNNKAYQDIKNLLMKDAKMSDADASKIASAIHNRVKGMRIPKTSTDQKRYSKSIDQGNIHDIMKEFDLHPYLKTGLIKCLTDLDAGTVSIEKTKHDLSQILQEAGLSATDANYTAEMLLINKNLLLRTEDSVVFTKRRSTLDPKELSPMQRENFVEIAEKEISDFLNDLIKDDSSEARKIIEEKLSKLADILGEIISDSTVKDKKKAALGHILDFFNDLRLKTNTPTAELTKLLADRILNIGFQTSTPKKEGLLPHKQSFENSSINYEADSVENPQAQYMNQLIDILQAWMEDAIPKKLDRTFINKMAKVLAADNFNRHKYLQLNPDAKTSNEEELARLKYNLYTMAKQTLNGDDLSLVMQNVDDLMEQIEKLKKPYLETTTEKVATSQMSSDIDEAYQSTSIPVQDSNEFIKENLKGGVQDWLKSLPLYQRKNKDNLQNMIPRLVSAIMSVIENAPTAEEADKLFIEEIVKQLKKSLTEPDLKSDETFLRNTAAALLENLNELQLFQDISGRQETSTDTLQAILDDWMGSLPIKRLNSSEAMEFEKLKQDFAFKLEKMRKKDPNDDEEIKKIIHKNLLNFPIEESTKKNQKLMHDIVENLFRNLLIVPIKESESKSRVNKKAADILFDFIEDWCEKLPFKSTSPQAKQEIAKKEIASKLINKIGELNMNPEVFNDEFLYNQMFEDELDNLLADMFSGGDKKNLPALKKNLLEKINEARQKTQEEIAGQTYKHQLRETISKNVPFQTLSAEEKAAFEAVKDVLVDTFINLHYVGDNEEQKQNYKTNIKKELSKFCDDYLLNHENVPLDTAKLNENLYQALKAVPIPKDETLIPEVELAKVKEQVNKWVKELPLMIAGDEKLKVDKLAAVLAKKIHDIEKQNELEHTDFDDILTRAILQWMDKLPKQLDENIKNIYANKLVDNLGKTREIRRVNADMRRSMDAEFLDETLNKSVSCIEHCKLPCTHGILSIEDYQHLEQIRARAKCTQQKDTGSQTATPPCETKSHLIQEAGSPAEVVPRLIVKEYYWDTASSQFVESYSPCSREYPSLSPIFSSCSPISSPCSPISLPRSPISSRHAPISSRHSPISRPRSPISSPRSPISPCCSMNSPIYSPTPGSCVMPHSLYSPTSSNTGLRSPKHTALSQHTLEANPCRSENRPASYQHQATGFEQGPSPPSPDLSQRGPSRRLPDDHEPCSPCPYGVTQASTETPLTSYHRAEIPSVELHCRGHCAKTMLGVADKRPCRKFRGDRDCSRQKLEDCVRAQPFDKRIKPEGFSCCGNFRNRHEEIKRCSKCCGIHCPFPSNMYFK